MRKVGGKKRGNRNPPHPQTNEQAKGIHRRVEESGKAEVEDSTGPEGVGRGRPDEKWEDSGTPEGRSGATDGRNPRRKRRERRRSRGRGAGAGARGREAETEGAEQQNK